jgi:hypothetical protein
MDHPANILLPGAHAADRTNHADFSRDVPAARQQSAAGGKTP